MGGLQGCITTGAEVKSCWLGVCFGSHYAFDNSDPDFDASVELGHWLTSVCLWAIAGYNIYWFRFEKRLYNEYAVNKQGPIGKIADSRPPDANEVELAKVGSETASKNDNTDNDIISGGNNNNDNNNNNVNELDIPAYPWMRLIQIEFALVTGFFALFREVYQLGKPLLIGAALHNLGEWGMISFIFHKTVYWRYYSFIIEFFGIWLVICFVVMIPTFPGYALAEQITGILVDYLLPMAWFALYYKQKDPDDKRMYLIAFIAHTIHLWFTIIPLVIENLVVGQSITFSTIMEFCIYCTSPITHILYTVFVPRFQTAVARYHVYPDKFVLSHKLFGIFFAISFVLGLLTTTILPAAIGECEDDSSTSSSTSSSSSDESSITGLCTDGSIVGQSSAQVYSGMEDAFEYWIYEKQLVLHARNFSGNNYYYFIRDNTVYNGYTQYQFFESWESISDLYTWLADYPQEVFVNATYQMLYNRSLSYQSATGYTQLENCNNGQGNFEYGLGAIRSVIYNNCSVIWNVISDLNDCTWIYGCNNVIVYSNTKRQLQFTGYNYNETTITNDDDNMVFKYSIINDAYIGQLDLNDNDHAYQCLVKYDFNLTDAFSETYEQVYEDFLQNRIPYMKGLFDV